MNPAWLLPMSVLVPFVLAACLIPRATRGAALLAAPWAPLPGFLLLLLSDGNGWQGSWFLLGSHLGLDAVSRIALSFTLVIWLAGGILAREYFRGSTTRVRFMGAFLVAFAGNLIAVLAQDAMSFLVGFALMSFTSYGLVVHSGTASALRAGRIYLVMVVLGEAALFAGLMLLISSTGPFVFPLTAGTPPGITVFLLLFGFGIKAGLVPLHVWLPLAHPAAPVPASAALSGAMIKVGLLGWIRFLPAAGAGVATGELLLTLGLAGIFLAALAGMTQSSPKAALAYSSVSQMGFITVALSLGFLDPHLAGLATTVALAYAAHHGLAKAALFLSVGLFENLPAGSALRRLALGLVALPALSLVGAPWTSGWMAKTGLKTLVGKTPESTEALPWLLSAGAIGTTLVLLRFFSRLPSGAPDQRPSPWSWISVGIPVLASVILTWTLPTWGPYVAKLWKLSSWLTAVWPVAVALVAAVLLRRLPLPTVPPGDVVVPLERLTFGVARMIQGQRRIQRPRFGGISVPRDLFVHLVPVSPGPGFLFLVISITVLCGTFWR